MQVGIAPVSPLLPSVLVPVPVPDASSPLDASLDPLLSVAVLDIVDDDVEVTVDELLVSSVVVLDMLLPPSSPAGQPAIAVTESTAGTRSLRVPNPAMGGMIRTRQPGI